MTPPLDVPAWLELLQIDSLLELHNAPKIKELIARFPFDGRKKRVGNLLIPQVKLVILDGDLVVIDSKGMYFFNSELICFRSMSIF